MGLFNKKNKNEVTSDAYDFLQEDSGSGEHMTVQQLYELSEKAWEDTNYGKKDYKEYLENKYFDDV